MSSKDEEFEHAETDPFDDEIIERKKREKKKEYNNQTRSMVSVG